jgi:hypothetical protein
MVVGCFQYNIIVHIHTYKKRRRKAGFSFLSQPWIRCVGRRMREGVVGDCGWLVVRDRTKNRGFDVGVFFLDAHP